MSISVLCSHQQGCLGGLWRRVLLSAHTNDSQLLIGVAIEKLVRHLQSNAATSSPMM